MYLDLIFDPMGAKKKLRIRKNKKIIAFWVNLNTKYQNQADSVRPNIVIFGSVFFWDPDPQHWFQLAHFRMNN